MDKQGKQWVRDLELNVTLAITYDTGLTCACSRYRCVQTDGVHTTFMSSRLTILRNRMCTYEPMR